MSARKIKYPDPGWEKFNQSHIAMAELASAMLELAAAIKAPKEARRPVSAEYAVAQVWKREFPEHRNCSGEVGDLDYDHHSHTWKGFCWCGTRFMVAQRSVDAFCKDSGTYVEFK